MEGWRSFGGCFFMGVIQHEIPDLSGEFPFGQLAQRHPGGVIVLVAQVQLPANYARFHAEQYDVYFRHLELSGTGQASNFDFERRFFMRFANDGVCEIFASIQLSPWPFPAADAVAISIGAADKQTTLLVIKDHGLTVKDKGLGWHELIISTG